MVSPSTDSAFLRFLSGVQPDRLRQKAVKRGEEKILGECSLRTEARISWTRNEFHATSLRTGGRNAKSQSYGTEIALTYPPDQAIH
jgi:hypothetical protein